MLTEQDKKSLKQTIQSNTHELYMVSIEEFDAIIRSSPAGKKPNVQAAWQKIKGKTELGASYYASADDIRTISKLVGDLGSFGTKAYVKTYGGKPHIILKGHPGLRKILTGTKYGIKNPKVVTMGLGKVGAIHAAKSGGIITIVLLTAYRVTDYFLTDEVTLNQLIGTLSTDVVKVGIATGASIATASLLVTLGFTIAIGPIVAVVVVGIITSAALGALDNQFGITDRVIKGLDEIENNVNLYIERTKQDIQDTTNDVIESVIDYAIESAKNIIINTARHHIDKFLSTQPRVF
jgi:hypothetical protein